MSPVRPPCLLRRTPSKLFTWFCKVFVLARACSNRITGLRCGLVSLSSAFASPSESYSADPRPAVIASRGVPLFSLDEMVRLLGDPNLSLTSSLFVRSWNHLHSAGTPAKNVMGGLFETERVMLSSVGF